MRKDYDTLVVHILMPVFGGSHSWLSLCGNLNLKSSGGCRDLGAGRDSSVVNPRRGGVVAYEGGGTRRVLAGCGQQFIIYLTPLGLGFGQEA